jgi:formate/nitrite transporter FocA (FNT family)
MTDDTRLWLPWMLTLLGNVIGVTFTAWFNTRSVRAMFAELRQAMHADIAELREEIGATKGARVKPETLY